MNPIVIAGGIIALLLLNRKSKAQTQMPQSSGPIPSPANPSGLDKPTGSSTTSDPIASPANPAGLDVPSEPISSPANPDVLEKDVEPAVVYEVVSDGNWTPSPANPKGLEEELMLDTSTPVSSPANPSGLVDILISNEESKSGSSSSDPIASPANPSGLDKPTGPSTTSDPIASPANPKGLDKAVSTTKSNNPNTDPTLKDPQTGLSLLGANLSGETILNTKDGGRLIIGFDKNYPPLNKREVNQFQKLANSYGVGEPIKVYNGQFDGKGYFSFGGFGSFERWLLGQTGFTLAQAGKGKLAGGPYSRRIYLLGKQKGLLNVETIKKYIQYRDKKVAEYKAQLQKSKERAAKPTPKVFAGKVLDANGNYVTPKGQQDCPDGYKYISNAGWSGCVSPERYEQWAIQMAYAMNDIPVRLTSWTGIRNGVEVRNSRKFSKTIDYPEHIFKKNISGYGLSYTDSLKGLTNSFKFKNNFWGTKDGKYVILYGKVRVKMNDGKIKKFYVVYPVTKEEFDKWKEAAYYIELSKKKK